MAVENENREPGLGVVLVAAAPFRSDDPWISA